MYKVALLYSNFILQGFSYLQSVNRDLKTLKGKFQK
jgi:hypothetical protein